VAGLTAHTFTGQVLDPHTGLMYYRARWYEPRLGRFVSADTVVPNLGNPQDLNRYAYTRNNPLRYTDPTGHCPWCVPLAIAVLKGIDYGWTAYDVWQATRVLRDAEAPTEEKLAAGLTIALAGLEALEPDDWLPVALPLDDVARRGINAGFKEAVARGGLRAGVRYLREVLGEYTPQVIRRLYDQGLFREVRSAREWAGILNGVRREAGLEVHHLIERRFARQFGWDPDEIPAVVLDRTFHQQEVTARLFSEELGLPTGSSYSAQQVWDTYVRVYGTGPGGLNRPDWLEAIWPYFEQLGVRR